jgi:lysozyme
MRISQRGLDELIKPSEGYHEAQEDGSCKAYRCPAGVWTCGWGCTSGVNQHTHWTEAEAEAALANEMRKHEASIEKLVKVPLNQNQFDAMVSLCYNIGEGNLGKSTLLKKLNAGDYSSAASHFADWKYATIRNETTARSMGIKVGTKAVLPGLVTRRAKEADMFLGAAPSVDMVQKVDLPGKENAILWAWRTVKATIASLTTVGFMETISPVSPSEFLIPAAPSNLKQSIVNLHSWSDVASGQTWQLLLVGGLAFGGVWLFHKVRS